MEILGTIQQWDEALLFWANSLFPSSTDTFWQAATKTISWAPLYVVLLARIIRSADSHSNWLFRIALVILGVLLWDQGANLAKSLVARPRPCHELSELRVLAHCAPFGMFSAHAANSFGLAFLVRKWAHPSWFPILLLTAAIQSFSRLHLGVHYPSDLLVGALFGILVARLLNQLDAKFNE